MDPLRITSGWSLENAKLLLEASAWTYANPCGLQTDLCHCQVFDLTNQDGVIVVAFRGSASVRDWITDCEFVRTKIGAGEEIHHGFLDALISMSRILTPAVKDVVARYRNGARGLFVTGHSLGGAMAVLGAQALRRAGLLVDAVYTFGGPRVGNGRWARQYDFLLGSMTWRVVNEEDIVPRIPGVLMGYRHVGQEVFLEATYTGYCVNPPLWSKAFSDLVGTVKGWTRGKVEQLEDHRTEAYRARLDAVNSESPVSVRRAIESQLTKGN